MKNIFGYDDSLDDDVFYLTSNGKRLTEEQERDLREALLSSIEENGR